MQKHARHMPLSDDVDIGRIARDARMQGFSGADVAGLCREAAMFCIKGNLGSDAVDSASVSSSAGVRVKGASHVMSGHHAAFRLCILCRFPVSLKARRKTVRPPSHVCVYMSRDASRFPPPGMPT